jgi:hypothetical protein
MESHGRILISAAINPKPLTWELATEVRKPDVRDDLANDVSLLNLSTSAACPLPAANQIEGMKVVLKRLYPRAIGNPLSGWPTSPVVTIETGGGYATNENAAPVLKELRNQDVP